MPIFLQHTSLLSTPTLKYVPTNVAGLAFSCCGQCAVAPVVLQCDRKKTARPDSNLHNEQGSLMCTWAVCATGGALPQLCPGA